MTDAADFSLVRCLVAESVGTALLLATVVGSGIMGVNLSQGNDAIALLGNTLATGAILYVLITALGPISGAHFNPAVTIVMCIKRQLNAAAGAGYIAAQVVGAIAGVMCAHGMFDLPLLQSSQTPRTGANQWFAEGVATFGLLTTILLTVRFRAESVALAVGLYITAGYWFTASTSFANPAVTLARSMTDTFSGIAPQHVAGFVLAQIVGALLALAWTAWLLNDADR